jgi:DNA-binding transcriptional LysR family regulator
MLHLTLRQLQVFEAVARNLSFSRAAKELHLSQPGVSMQVKQLEETVGQPLFEQLGKRLFLTEAGRAVLRASQTVAQQIADLEYTLQDLRGLEQGRLTVGVVSTVGQFAIRLISLFRQLHPGVRINLNVVNRETLLIQLAENQVDFALMGKPPDGQDLESTPFMDNPLVVIAPGDHAMRDQHAIPLAWLAEQQLVAREPGSGTRVATEAFFAQHGLSLRAAMEMNKNEAIKLAVEASLGLGVVSRHTVNIELESGRLICLDVQGFPLMRQWHLVHRRHKRFGTAGQALADFVLNEATRVVAG